MPNKGLRILKYNLLCAAAISALMSVGGHAAYSAEVSFTGSNATIQNGCATLAVIPNSCVSAVMTPFVNVTAPDYHFGATLQDSAIIGSNLSNSNTGAAASGGVRLIEGGAVTSSLLYVGFEANTEGEISIDGAGSNWLNTSAGRFGFYGTGSLIVTDGGLYKQTSIEHIYFGYHEGAQGYGFVSGVNAVTGERSSVISQDGMYVGRDGHGELYISDGGYFETGHSSSIAGKATGTGVVTVTGVHEDTGFQSTLKIADRQLWVGSSGPGNHGTHGELFVLDGGLLEVQDEIGADGKSAQIVISGVNAATGKRSTAISTSLQAGNFEDGRIHILDGAFAHVNFAAVALKLGGNGLFEISGVNAVTGDRSTLLVDTNLYASQESLGVFDISKGAYVEIQGQLRIADLATGTGVVNISDAGTQVNAKAFSRIAGLGHGTLNLTNYGTLITPELIIAEFAGSNGTLYMGKGQLAGVLDTEKITAGLGDAYIIFDHIGDINFTPEIIGDVDVSHINTGTTKMGIASTHGGTVSIDSGTIMAGGNNYLSPNANYKIGDLGKLNLAGHDQIIFSLHNAGLLDFGVQTETNLNITDLYEGNNGVIAFSMNLDGNTNAHNMLVAKNTKGHTFIKINNQQSHNEKEVYDIKLVDVLNDSDGTFTLLGDYVHSGAQTAVLGAYAYKLYQGGTTSPNDGNWYLRSELTPSSQPNSKDPLFQAGVPTYASYPRALLGLNGLNSLQERVGNRIWYAANNVSSASLGMGASGDNNAHFSAPQIDEQGIWGRVEGAHNYIKLNKSATVNHYKQNIFKGQVGFDNAIYKSAQGTLIAGVLGQYIYGKTDTSSVYGDGKISTDGYGIGAALTWYDSNDFYIDGQAQATWYQSDLSSKLTRASLAHNNKGFGYSVSAEVGRHIAIAPKWSVTPQAQLSFLKVEFDSFNDAFKARVQLDDGHRLEGRLGLTVDHDSAWENDKGTFDMQHLYGVANVYYEFEGNNKVDVAGMNLTAKNSHLWAGIGVGGAYSWDDGQYSIYGEAIANTGLKNFGDSYKLQGSAGLRVRF